MLTLRPDQSACLDAVQVKLLQNASGVLLVAPTGWGKTVVFAELTRRAIQAGQRVFILVHRAELLEQVSRTLTALEVEHGCIAPGYPNYRFRAVQVASAFTLCRRLADHLCPDLIIIDEAHHAIGRSTWGAILRAYGRANRLGVTATPERLSGEGLRETFDSLIEAPSVNALIAAGHLSPYRLFAPPQSATDGLHQRMGDYVKRELSVAMDRSTITGDAVSHYRSLALGKRAIVFCVSIAHAEHVAQEFMAAGIPASSIDGSLDRRTRAQRLDAFREGRISILTSCDLISEGFDLPAIEVAILLRPTQSLALHLQQVGRSLRPFPGKQYALILDHAGNTMRHGLPDEERTWSLDGKAARQAHNGERAMAVRTCGQCFAAVKAPIAVCPYCGYVWPAQPREVEQVEGALVEIDQAMMAQQKKQEVGMARDLEALKVIEKQRGYKPGWSYHVMRSREKRYARN